MAKFTLVIIYILTFTYGTSFALDFSKNNKEMITNLINNSDLNYTSEIGRFLPEEFAEGFINTLKSKRNINYDIDDEEKYLLQFLLRHISHDNAYLNKQIGETLAQQYIYKILLRKARGFPTYTQKEAEPYINLLNQFEDQYLVMLRENCYTYIENLNSKDQNFHNLCQEIFHRVQVGIHAMKQSFTDPTYASVPTNINPDSINVVLSKCKTLCSDLLSNRKVSTWIDKYNDNLYFSVISKNNPLTDTPENRLLEAGSVLGMYMVNFYEVIKMRSRIEPPKYNNLEKPLLLDFPKFVKEDASTIDQTESNNDHENEYSDEIIRPIPPEFGEANSVVNTIIYWPDFPFVIKKRISHFYYQTTDNTIYAGAEIFCQSNLDCEKSIGSLSHIKTAHSIIHWPDDNPPYKSISTSTEGEIWIQSASYLSSNLAETYIPKSTYGESDAYLDTGISGSSRTGNHTKAENGSLSFVKMECKKSTSSEYVRTIYDSLSKPSNFSPESEQHHINSTKSQKYLTVPLLPAVVNCSGYHQSWLKDFQFTIMSNRLEAEGNEFDGNACYYSNVKTGGFAYFNPLFHVNESASESH